MAANTWPIRVKHTLRLEKISALAFWKQTFPMEPIEDRVKQIVEETRLSALHT
jgi:hypothetical protein